MQIRRMSLKRVGAATAPRATRQRLAITVAVALLVPATAAWAKLPPPTDEQKAKSAEAASKAAAASKAQAELLGKAQDRVAEKYAAKLQAEGKAFTPTPLAPAK